MSNSVSQEILDAAMAKAFMTTLRSAIEEKLRADIEPLIQEALNDAAKTFESKAAIMVDVFKDERLIKIIVERKSC